MITIPAQVRARLGIREGSKVEFVETEEGVLLVPLKTLKELRGVFKAHDREMRQAIRELEREHRGKCVTERGAGAGCGGSYPAFPSRSASEEIL